MLFRSLAIVLAAAVAGTSYGWLTRAPDDVVRRPTTAPHIPSAEEDTAKFRRDFNVAIRKVKPKTQAGDLDGGQPDTGNEGLKAWIDQRYGASGTAFGEENSVAPNRRSSTGGRDRLHARFGMCFTGGGTNCVVDGDTFWFAGTKYRIADIDAPETHPSRCAHEAKLGNAATARLQTLLNAGGFSLEIADRESDRYGRKLRVVTRAGVSVGGRMVNEGLAREWTGRRQPWC